MPTKPTTMVDRDPAGAHAFFMGAMLVMLTVGATWGTLLLYRIATAGKFTDISIHDINAHGHAQIFGWFGLLIMGLSYVASHQASGCDARLAMYPRWPRHAIAVPIMLVGLLLRVPSMWWPDYGAIVRVGLVVGALLEGLAVWMYWRDMRSLRRTRPTVGTGWLFAAACWMLLQVPLSAWHAWRVMNAWDAREALLDQVATWQVPLRDMQVHGMTLCAAIGLCLLLVPGAKAWSASHAKGVKASLVVVTTAIVLEAGLFLTYRFTGVRAVVGAIVLPWLMIAVGVALVGGPIAGRAGDDAFVWRGYIRAGFVWIAIALVMLLLMPVYQVAYRHVAEGFSHAYNGAIRHALTVGGTSVLLMGLVLAAALRPVPPGAGTPRATGPLALLMVGCAMRVALQVASDWHAMAFKLIVISGVIEVTAIAWWAVTALRLMRTADPLVDDPAAAAAGD